MMVRSDGEYGALVMRSAVKFCALMVRLYVELGALMVRSDAKLVCWDLLVAPNVYLCKETGYDFLG